VRDGTVGFPRLIPGNRGAARRRAVSGRTPGRDGIWRFL